MAYRYRHLNNSDIPWTEIEQCHDSTVFKTRAWSRFLQDSLHVSPYIIEIAHDDGEVAGWFYAQLITRMGIKVLASPFEGWTTSYQGLCMRRRVSVEERMEIYRGLFDHCLSTSVCHMVQVSDWQLPESLPDTFTVSSRVCGDVCGGTSGGVRGRFGVVVENCRSIYLDITPDEDRLLRSFRQKSARYSISKATRLGVTVREAQDMHAFAKAYYAQLRDVFDRQNLVPPYDESRVSKMLEALHCTGMAVALEALHPQTGESMATIIFIHHNGLAFYWGAASWRQYHAYCPNELLFFEAVKRLKQRGVTTIEMEGIRKYKEKYNPTVYSKPKLMAARHTVTIRLKTMAKRAYYAVRRCHAKLKGLWK